MRGARLQVGIVYKMNHIPNSRARAWITSLVTALSGASLPAAAADYPTTVLADQPLGYYRLQTPTRTNLNLNSGSLGIAGNATNFNVYPVGGGIAGSRNGAAYFNGSRTIIPFQAALNPAGNKDFTIEAWIQPTLEVTDAPGPAPLMNRYSYSGVNRQGWVFFQRSPTTGWNFRTYTGVGSSTGINITGQASNPGAGTAGTWNHLVLAYEGATTTATLYVNGEQVAQDSGGYQANTDDHGAEAVNGAAGLGLGSYNNTQPGDNAFTGAIDEVAFYASKLTAAQVLTHYQNGTNAARTTPYEQVIAAANPVAYLRLNDPSPDSDLAVNFGTAGTVGNGVHASGVNHPVRGLFNEAGPTAARYQSRDAGGGVQTLVPFTDKLNPPADQSFTVEAWFQPATEVTDSPGPAPIMNRYSYSGVNRQGWVYFQRSPASGWNFRTYTGNGSSTGINITGQASTPNAGKKGTWNHVVTVWNGPTQTATMYVNGEKVAEGTGGYQANTDDHGAEAVNGAAGLSIGSYNNTQLGDNAYNGAVEEFAFYSAALTQDSIVAHYRAGTNQLGGAAYAAVILAEAPVEYLRLGEPAIQPTANSGSAGEIAAGNGVSGPQPVSGPKAPQWPGFGAANPALSLDGTNAYVSLGDATALNIRGAITLEAWIQPAATQGTAAQILAHGINFAGDAAVSLAIVDSGASYFIGSTDASGTDGASFLVPAGDLGGGNWIHLAGTYDGTKWNLYRNGILVASKVDAIGSVNVDALWAIGHNGEGSGAAFAGAIDEVALFGKALTAAQIKAHYDAAAASTAAPVLAWKRTGTALSLQWTAGILQSTDTVNGTFSDVPAAASPYPVTVNSATRFYRLR